MTSLRRARTFLTLPIVGLVLVALAPAAPSAARVEASLRVTPGKYVGGQSVTFEGNIGQRGERRISLQTHMNRPGDAWNGLDGNFSTMTRADGSFEFTNPAPAMFGIRMRVVSGRLATPAVSFNASSQDLTLDVEQPGMATPEPGVPAEPAAGEPFTIRVDTTPDHLFRRPDVDHTPAYPGRVLTLQQRTTFGTWQDLDTTETNSNGIGTFTRTVSQRGTVVYRAIQENWGQHKDGSSIGWFPSFPTAVNVGGAATAADPAAGLGFPSQRARRLPRISGHTASSKYRWGPSKFDFAWEFGESLTSRAYRGSDRRGWWQDASDGYGRVARHNGGLMIDSQRDNPADRYPATFRGDLGTTSATLHGNAMSYGRWEAKMRLKRAEGKGKDYRAMIELVPEADGDYRCGAQNITVADVVVNGDRRSTLRYGVKARNGQQWHATRRYTLAQTSPHAFAVEVSRRHISWFVDSTLVGTVKSRAAVSDVPMTLRLSLVGDGDTEMNKTEFISDWQRGWPLNRSALRTNGARLARSAHSTGC